MQTIKDICSLGPIIPVITLEKAADVLPLADALAEGGIKVMEITLRTSAALEAIALLLAERKNMIVGAGTVTTPEQFENVCRAGAQFVVSPGVTEKLLHIASQYKVPYLPGVATTSEALFAMEHGYHLLKFYPAEMAGGVPLLKNFATLFSGITFCPTGGITHNNMNEYLGLPNVACVGGSWVASNKAIREKRWGEITRLVRESLAAANHKAQI